MRRRVAAACAQRDVNGFDNFIFKKYSFIGRNGNEVKSTNQDAVSMEI